MWCEKTAVRKRQSTLKVYRQNILNYVIIWAIFRNHCYIFPCLRAIAFSYLWITFLKLCFQNGIISTKTFCVAFYKKKFFRQSWELWPSTNYPDFQFSIARSWQKRRNVCHVRESKNEIKDQVENLEISRCN